MRTFLVVTDDSEETRAAMRFAARRAVAVDGAVHILGVVRQQNVSAFGGVQATIEQEARDRAEMLAHGVAGNLLAESGIIDSPSCCTVVLYFVVARKFVSGMHHVQRGYQYQENIF